MTGTSTLVAGSTAPVVRRVEHVMGMPISLALRGAHADDAIGLAVWAAVLFSLRDADAVFSTWRDDRKAVVAAEVRTNTGVVVAQGTVGVAIRAAR